MPEAKIAQAVQLLDLMLEHFADDSHWTRAGSADRSDHLVVHLDDDASREQKADAAV
jgi:hypothetical protein